MKYVAHTAFGLALLTVGCAATTYAQAPGSCSRSLGEAYLDVGNVRARILNTGGLFWRGEPHVYEVPKGGGTHALFNAGIWLGGLVDDELRMSATRYGEWEFWAGPLDEQANPSVDCARYDHLYSIYRDDIIAYHATGRVTADLAAWPVDLGAPVVDGDGIDGNYNLEAGDRPALIGDQMLWWVMNDVGNVHQSSVAPPMGMEIHATAFAFHRPGTYIDDVTFYRYVLHYKGAAPLEEAYFGLFSDPDLGDFSDDYLGSDSTLHLAFVYNADNLDGGGHGYGVAPPALGYTFLRSPVADHDGRDNDRDGTTDEPGEMRGMTSFLFYAGGGCVICDPSTAQDYYLYMQARWKDGKSLTVGGDYGRGFSDIPTKFAFSGDPTTGAFWSERNLDGQGSPQGNGDRRFIAASGPFTLQPGQTQEFIFAIVWARGRDHLDSVRELKKVTARLHEVADEILQVDLPQPAPPPEPTYGLGFAQNFPNPFSTATTIRYSLPQPIYVRLKVYDVLGRAIATLVDEQQDGGIYEVPFAAQDLPGGVYFYRIEMDHLRFTKPMMLLP